MNIVNIIHSIAGLFVVVATALPLVRHDDWWIRVFDFPRLQIAVLCLLVLAATPLAGAPKDLMALGIVAAVVLALMLQTYKIFSYTPLAPKQVRDSERATPNSSVSLVSANVRMSNRDSETFLAIVRDANPDILLVLEPDGWWEEQLRELERDYTYTVKKPLDNRYGMLLYSRLELDEPEIKYLIKENIPSMHTQVRLRSGALVSLRCLHPEPPSPTEAETSTERDAELLIVGEAVKDMNRPVIVAGDLNDVAWSNTTTLFQKISGLLDPRIGRGMFNSFHAQVPLMRWPLDHVFHSDDFLLVSLVRLPAFGSDHFPIYVKLSLDAQAEQLQNGAGPLQATEQKRVRTKFDEVDWNDEL